MLIINNYENIVGWKISYKHRMLTATHMYFIQNPEPSMVGGLLGIKWAYIIKLNCKQQYTDLNVSIIPMGSKEVPFINMWWFDKSKMRQCGIAFKVESMDYLQSPNTLLTYILKKLPE